MKLCPTCGQQIPVDSTTCPYCGTVLAPGGGAGVVGIPADTSAMDAEVRRLLGSGKKIHAIKHVRQQTGMGLLPAKVYVEAVESGGNAREAAAAAAARGGGKSGCASVFLIAAAMAGFALLLARLAASASAFH